MRRKLIFVLYRALGAAAFPLFLCYVLWRVARDRRYTRGLGERFGFLPASWKATAPGAVWLHAVSVGEVVSAAGLIRALKAALPSARIYVSCTTLAGREVAQQKLTGLADGVFFAPVDYVWAVRRVLRTLRPSLVLVLETEIWPNLWRESRRSGAALLIVNGRISDRAWPRYQEFAWFFREVLRLPDRVLVQSAHDRARYEALGAAAEVAGNLKYDIDPRSSPVAPVLRQWLEAAESVWVAASTMPPLREDDPDEDDAVLDAWEQVRASGRKLVLVPRKPERFDLAAQKLTDRGIVFVRRSTMQPGSDAPVLLLDTMGELAGLFRFATVVFMGGTLASRGGHNILEPAAFAKPVIVGPHMENFRAIAEHFAASSALVEIGSPAELAETVSRLLEDPDLREKIGERARTVAESERGATGRAVAAALELYRSARPVRLVYGPFKPLLWLLSRCWLAGLLIDRSMTRRRRLGTPVVSVGGLSMGGAGKTPLVRGLVRGLHERGHRVAILMRGYGRQQYAPLFLTPGSAAPVEQTGDEAQLYLRDGSAHVGIGADRYRAGLEMECRFQPDVFLLDDGFQHWALARDLDIVVTDGPPEPVFPLGLGREPASALGRAHIVVPKRLRPVRWVPLLPPEAKLGAFCGIGNPDSFWRTLDELGLPVVRRWTFADHHAYTPTELSDMLKEVDRLLTTEKDALKLPPCLPVHYLEVEFDLPTDLLDRVVSLLRPTEPAMAPPRSGS